MHCILYYYVLCLCYTIFLVKCFKEGCDGSEIIQLTLCNLFQLSLLSATSYESRYGAQVFANRAQYRGVMVRVKELKFCKKKDIPREIMKEMRLLRDIRHDNINSFIGACLEPMKVLILTDYCSKGSLYVSCIKFFSRDLPITRQSTIGGKYIFLLPLAATYLTRCN